MKKCIALIMVAVLMLLCVGCDISGILPANQSQQDSVVDSYRSSAQRLIDIGNYEGAVEVLKEGIEKTNSTELAVMLADVSQLIQNSKQEETEPAATEPTPTAPAETQPSLPQSPIVNLSGIQRRINVFLSNFAEVSFEAYPCNKYDMVSFAYAHARINKDGTIHYGNMEYYISERDVNNILYKYFGISYAENGTPGYIHYNNQHDISSIRYDGDYYYFAAADGGFFGYVAIANGMTRNSDNTYTVTFDVYSLVELWDDLPSNYYNYSAEQARYSPMLDYCYSGTAIVKDHTRSDGVQSYHLIEMHCT